MALKSKLINIKIKGCKVSSLIKRASALIFELHENTIYSLVKLKSQSSSIKIKEVFEEEKTLKR